MKKTCSIAIPFVNEKYFIKSILQQIDKCEHEKIETEIIIVNQSGDLLKKHIGSLKKIDVKIVDIEQIDQGWAIDNGLKHCEGEYVCIIDSDCWPVHKNWLYAPIRLIERHKLSFFGLNTGLELAEQYKNIGSKSPFYCINNNYMVCRTSLAKKLSKEVGFLKCENWEKAHFKSKKDVAWAKGIHTHSGIMTQWYSDAIDSGPKFSVCTNKFLGSTQTQGIYGVLLDDLVFHFVLGYGHTLLTDPQNDLSKEYLSWMNEIIKNKGVDSDILNEMIDSLKSLYRKESNRVLWIKNKKTIISQTSEIYKDFENFKNS